VAGADRRRTVGCRARRSGYTASRAGNGHCGNGHHDWPCMAFVGQSTVRQLDSGGKGRGPAGSVRAVGTEDTRRARSVRTCQRRFPQAAGIHRTRRPGFFGNLVHNNVPVGIPVGATNETATLTSGEFWANTGASFAFSVLPTIIFFASLVSVLYYLGIMERIVKGLAWVMFRTMRTSGAETLSVAGNIFIGPTESPLLIKPFISAMTSSELTTVMVGGFATIAGGVMAAYVGMLSPYFPDIAGHLLTASVMNAPAALLISKILVPETDEPVTRASLDISVKTEDANLIDAAAGGAAQGLKLALNVGAMLMAFIALIAMFNAIVGGLGGLVGLPELSLQQIFGWVLAPLAWLMGVPWADAVDVGSLMGIKVVINDFVAYLQLAGGLEAGSTMSPRAIIICTYALLGFANFATIAILIGGVGSMAPERRGDLSRLGLRAMIGGNLAAFMSASRRQPGGVYVGEFCGDGSLKADPLTTPRHPGRTVGTADGALGDYLPTACPTVRLSA